MMPAYLSTLSVGEIVAGGAAVGVLIGLFRKVFPWIRNMVHFMDDLTGEAARKGRPAVPGLLERQLAVEAALEEIRLAVKELKPNGGASIKDVATRMDAAMHVQTERLGDLNASLKQVSTNLNEHVAHGMVAEVELRAAVSSLQSEVFKDKR